MACINLKTSFSPPIVFVYCLFLLFTLFLKTKSPKFKIKCVKNELSQKIVSGYIFMGTAPAEAAICILSKPRSNWMPRGLGKNGFVKCPKLILITKAKMKMLMKLVFV